MAADTLPETLRAQAHSRNTHPLLICDAEQISYAEAARRSAALAGRLVELGAAKGTHIGLLYPNGTDFVVGMLAAARIGAVVVPFPTLAPAPELRSQLSHSDVRILLAAESYRSHDYRRRLAEALPDVDIAGADPLFSRHAPQLRRVVFDASAPRRIPAILEALEADVDGSDPLAIVYTSGSTGAPKGVIHTHAGLLGHQRNLNEIRRLTAEDVLFCNAPFFWIGGFAFALLATILAGSTLLCSNATDPGATLDLLEAEKPTMANGYLSSIGDLASHPSLAGRDLSTLRRGNLYPLLAPAARPADPELRHGMFGLTETGGPVLLSEDHTDQPEHRRGSFGKPAPGFECRIVDGELLVRGRYLMQRYHKRNREDCFDADGWFHTGDLFRTDADGFHYYLGRRDAVIKTAGATVSPAEVERAIAKLIGVTAYVFGIPDTLRGQSVAAVLVQHAPCDAEQLRQRLKEELSTYKIPRRFTTIPPAEVPLLPSGKVDLRALAKAFDA